MPEHDVTFDCMGCEVRLLVGTAARTSRRRAGRGGGGGLAHEFDAALSRFKPESELVALNDDPREVVPASPLRRAAVAAGRWAAERSGGLVDPTLRPGRARSRRLRRVAGRPGAAVAGGGARGRPAARIRPRPTPPRAGARCRPTRPRAPSPPAGRPHRHAAGRARAWPPTPWPCASPRVGRFAVDCARRPAGRRPRAPRRRPYDIQALHPLTGEAMRTVRDRVGARSRPRASTRACGARRGRSPTT